jgi:hypothetical protein
MGISEDIFYVGELLDKYGAKAWKMGVASTDPDDSGVPPSMQVGEIDEEGWVEWRMLPSTLTETDVAAIEDEYNITFSSLFRAYLLARFHLFDSVGSQKYKQQILLTATPENCPLSSLCNLLSAWKSLLRAKYIPFAEWGDGWGPMCFDTLSPTSKDDYAIVWFDHEHLISLGEEATQQRKTVAPYAQLLYPSFQKFLTDVFGDEGNSR